MREETKQLVAFLTAVLIVLILLIVSSFSYGNSQGDRKLRQSNINSFIKTHTQDAKSYQLCLEADAGSNCQAILGKSHN